MNDAHTESIAATIAETKAERANLASLAFGRHNARASIEAAITAAVQSLDALEPALENALTAEATGEGTPAEVAGVRAAVAAAEKVVISARKREGEAREL